MANKRIPDCAAYLMANTAPHLADAISTALQNGGRLSLLSLLDKAHESARESLSPDRIRAIMGTIDDRARESFEAAIRLSYEALGSAFADRSLWDRRRTFATRRILLHNLAQTISLAGDWIAGCFSTSPIRSTSGSRVSLWRGCTHDNPFGPDRGQVAGCRLRSVTHGTRRLRITLSGPQRQAQESEHFRRRGRAGPLELSSRGREWKPELPDGRDRGALGLRLEDLFPPKSNGSTPKAASKPKRTHPTVEAALSAVASKIQPQPIKTQSWTYRDAHGNVAMIVGRFDAADGSKTYRPFHPLLDGSWAIGDPPGLLPLYRLHEIAGEDGAAVCEGEKCADALDSIDFIATTSAHGSQSPHKTDWSPLAGKDVTILPDNDPPGEGYATALLRIFKRLDPRPTVRIIRLSGLGDGEDVADWLPRVMAGRSGEDAVEHARSEYERLWNEAPVVDLGTIEDAPSEAPRPVADCPEIEAPIPVPEWPDPPEDAAFHELAGMIVKLIEPSTEADTVALLLQLLIGFGSAVGRGAWVVADGHFHYANEFAVCVGDTSRARKGTSWRRVRPVLAHADPGWADSRITGGLSSGEGLIFEIRDPVFGVDDKRGPGLQGSRRGRQAGPCGRI